MCGICGSYHSTKETPVRLMVAALAHRGPDGQGVRGYPNAVLGHTRLAIIDPASGHQPMEVEGSGLVFNGEIYNFRQLRHDDLAGEDVRTNSDTEVLLRLYRKLGPAAVDKLDGMFAFAIVHQGDLFLARDPLGIKPLYYGWQDEVFHFASEIKALAPICEEIREFPAGNWFHSRLGWNQYYGIGTEIRDFYGHEDDAMREYRSVLARAVTKRLIADVPVGVSLSGGLDSSIVAWLATREHPHIETFAVGMEGGQDLPAARLVAKTLQTVHHELVYTEDDMVQALPEVLRHLESFDPALVRSAIPNYFLARLAATRVKVMLTGEGADELFAGYDYMDQYAKPGDLARELIIVTKALHNTNLQRADRMGMAHGLEARVPFLDRESVAVALGVPAQWKLHEHRVPKAFLRKAFAGELPDGIINRPKLKFSAGTGSSRILETIAESGISDADFAAERQRMMRLWRYALPNKEALYYYRILSGYMEDPVLFSLMGVSRSL